MWTYLPPLTYCARKKATRVNLLGNKLVLIAAKDPKIDHVTIGPNNLSAETREWYQQAVYCAQQADAQTDPKVKQQFLELKRRALILPNLPEMVV
jgi:hypothetical protein